MSHLGVVVVEGDPVGVSGLRNRRLEEIGGAPDGGHAHDPAVGDAGDAESRAIDVGERLEPLRAGGDVAQVADRPARVVGRLEGLSVSRAAADVGRQHDVAHAREEVRLVLEVVRELAGGAAVDVEDPREFLAGARVRRRVQIGVDGEIVARVRDLPRRDESALGGDRLREGELARRAAVRVDDEEIGRAGRGGEGVGDAPRVRRPRRAPDDAGRHRDEHARRAAASRNDAQVERPVAIGDEGDGAPVRRPASVALVGRLCGERPRRATGDGDHPVVGPPAARGTEEERGAVRRHQRRAEGAASPDCAVVEEAAVARHHARRAARGGDDHDVVVDPPVVGSHVDDVASVGGPLGRDLEEVARRQAADCAIGERDGPDVERAEPHGRECDAAPVRRPCKGIDAPADARELRISPVGDVPEPELGIPPPVGQVGDRRAVGGEARNLGSEVARQAGHRPARRIHGPEAPAPEARGKEDARAVAHPVQRITPEHGGHRRRELRELARRRRSGGRCPRPRRAEDGWGEQRSGDGDESSAVDDRCHGLHLVECSTASSSTSRVPTAPARGAARTTPSAS